MAFAVKPNVSNAGTLQIVVHGKFAKKKQGKKRKQLKHIQLVFIILIFI